MNKALKRAQQLATSYKGKNPELSEYNKKMQGMKVDEKPRKIASSLTDNDFVHAFQSLSSLIPKGETLTDEEQEQAVDREQARKNLQKSQGKK